jgi:pilus assembly protein CpaE
MNETLPLRIAVLAEDVALARLLQDSFKESGVEADLAMKIEGILEGGAAHLPKLRWAGAQILLAQVGQDVGAAVDTLQQVVGEIPGTTVMLAGPALPADGLLKIMRAGAVEYLPSPVTPTDVAEAVGRVLARRRASAGGEVRREGRALALFGPKGGTGVTTTAVNLALELRKLTGDSTVLVDLDLLGGGAEALLDLHARYTLADLIKSFHRLDEGLLSSFVITHPSGLDVLTAPRTALEGEKVTPEEVVQLVRVLRAHYARVVMDVGNVLTSVALSALTEADAVALVLTPHLEGVRNAKRMVGALGQRAPDLKRDMHVVLNRFVPDPPIAIDEIERALGTNVRTVLPFDEAMHRRSACGGRPAALTGPSKYGKNVRGLALATGELEPPAKDSGRVRSWLGDFLGRNGKRASAPHRELIPAGR